MKTIYFLFAVSLILPIAAAGLAQGQALSGPGITCYSQAFSGICIIGSQTQTNSDTGGAWHTHIVTTSFGGPTCGDKPGTMASGISSVVLPLYAALPTRAALSKEIQVRAESSGTMLTLKVLDVGPWNVKDDNYVFNTNVRPQAESGYAVAGPNAGRKTNRAGLDVSCQAAAQLGIRGEGITDWRFVN